MRPRSGAHIGLFGTQLRQSLPRWCCRPYRRQCARLPSKSTTLCNWVTSTDAQASRRKSATACRHVEVASWGPPSEGVGEVVRGHRPQQGGLVSITTARRDDKGWDPMRAIVQDRFGPPEVLRLVDAGLPGVGAGDVLVRVHAAALNPADWHILRGDPLVARLMGVGLIKPKARVAGIDAAGVVEAVGANVRGLRNGDEVLDFLRGAFAEHACAAADMVVPKPASLTFEQAAAVPIAATTALRGILDVGEVKAGQRVLVNGAGGGVGTYAVQIAAALGAEVTGVSSTRNVELVRSG